jgi:hypothetical protein
VRLFHRHTELPEIKAAQDRGAAELADATLERIERQAAARRDHIEVTEPMRRTLTRNHFADLIEDAWIGRREST